MVAEPPGTTLPSVVIAVLLLAILALLISGFSTVGAVARPVAVDLPVGAPASAVSVTLPEAPASTATPGFVPPSLTTAITDSPKLIYSYHNHGEEYPQDSQVSMFVNATGDTVSSYANVQVAFVVETTLYDGVYDPTQDDWGTDPCDAPCMESDGVPFFMANAGTIASDIDAKNPSASVSYAMIDYFATYDEHDDDDGAEYHVDIPSFVPASQFQSDVITGFKDPVMGGNTWYSDSDFSDSFLDSSMITALYGTLKGSGLNWNPADHHVIVLVSSSSPRDPNYPVNYADTWSDENTGMGSTCEPSYNYGSFTSPKCEGWVYPSVGNSIRALANTENVTIDTISLPDGMTIANSGDYTSTATGQKNVPSIIDAACDIAHLTNGSWAGPSGDSCPAYDGGQAGALAFVADGKYNNPNVVNPGLLGALTNISFGPTATSNVTAVGNGKPMIEFVADYNITPDPANPAWTVTCLASGKPVAGCVATPSVSQVGGVYVYGWTWPGGTMVLNESWRVTFNVVAEGPPYNVTFPLDACSGLAGCLTPAPTEFSATNYNNYLGVATTTSFPSVGIEVGYPVMSLYISPPAARAVPGTTILFTTSVQGGWAPYTYTWQLTNVKTNTTVALSNVTSFLNYTFTTPGSFQVKSRVLDSSTPTAGVATAFAPVTILVPGANAYYLNGTVTDASTHFGIAGVSVALNGTGGVTSTAGQGDYTLGPLPDGPYNIYVNASGYLPYAGTVTVLGPTWDNFSLQPAPPQLYNITGTVTDFATGAPLAGAFITAPPWANATAAVNGSYDLAGLTNGTYSVTASFPGYTSVSIAIPIFGSNVVQDFGLSVLPPAMYSIGGLIQSSVGHAAVSGANVTLTNVTAYGVYEWTLSNAAGSYLLAADVNGTYNETVTANGFVPAYRQVVIAGAPETIDFTLTAIPPPPPLTFGIAGTVAGTATNGTRVNIAGALITVESETGAKVASTVSAHGGDYAVLGLSNGTYTLIASANCYSSQELSATIDGASVSTDFDLASSTLNCTTTGAIYSIGVTVVDNATGAPLQGASLELTGAATERGTTTTGGAFSFVGLPTGSYNLVVSLSGFTSKPVPVTVDHANVSLTVDLTPLAPHGVYTLSGLVMNNLSGTAIVGATISASAPGQAALGATTEVGGGYSMLITNGTYTLSASAPGFVAGQFSVTIHGSDRTFDLNLTPLVVAGTNTPASPLSGLSPGPGGVYIYLWLPAVVAGALVVVALAERRRASKAPPP